MTTASRDPDPPTSSHGATPPAGPEPVVTMNAERYVMSGGSVPRLAAKEGDLFLYTNDLGQIPGNENSELGLYYRDTRYLSRFELLIAGRLPVLLSSTAESGYGSTIELTNLQARTSDDHLLPQASVHVRRKRYLADRLHELMTVSNYHQRELEVVLDLHFAADFADLFEVRGVRRRRRGVRMPARVEGDTIVLAYLGVDDIERRTIVRLLDRPESISEGRARYRLRLAPGSSAEIHCEVEIVAPGSPDPRPGGFHDKLRMLRQAHKDWDVGATVITTDNEQVNAVLRRGQDDLRMLGADIEGHRLPLSGMPWFVAPFGREMILAGLETPILDLRWAHAVADFLGEHQGRQQNVFREEQPGKIMHELRRGELANVRAVPHTPYFGAVDATPLWLLLVTELTMWTGDLEGFEERSAAIDAALTWLDRYGDPDQDGFIEYQRRSRAGLRNQGWRDGNDAVFHQDGTPAKGPIALAETQGYVFYAKRRLAALYGQLGDVERAERLTTEASELKRRFNEQFWMDDEGFYAMALDGEKRQVKTVCSTIGHALWARIVAAEHVPRVVRRLMAPDMYTGWGLRTVSNKMYGYNPISFYNGSVWPYDTAIAASGLKKHGYAEESNQMAFGLVEAAVAHEYSRLPELFCGFTRQAINKPVSFPMACSPDVGSSGALFLILQSMVGVYAQAEANIVYVHNPVLPRWLGEVSFSNLRVGRTTMRLRFRRQGSQTSFSVLDKQGPGRIIVVE
jgi:glycogen debranching enzyme